MIRRSRLVFFAAGAFLTVSAGCITVNIHFPERQLREAAEQIVDDVRPDLEPEADGDTSMSPLDVDGALASPGERVSLAFYAAAVPAAPGPAEEKEKKIELKVETPKIKAIKETLTKRYARKLRALYEAGRVGETNEGYLAARATEGLTLKESRDLKLVLRSENKDRKALYTEIAAQNSISKSDIAKIGRLFSLEWQKKCKTGWWIQDAKGKWIKKKPPPKKKKSA